MMGVITRLSGAGDAWAAVANTVSVGEEWKGKEAVEGERGKG